ncbi:hypothetical protein PGT21_037041 [Puccinia graminis f. sp. tritici]|uniref:DUF1682-domain-containing protein n=2 Tax=Puccinia graminis f. sp. tritici TaxID=56615 RepID=E3L2V3_PUCGT|nr:uncharacterized protein PGTG_17077 [Puccinia graminis f. sp. tritici CRL 75-36-700-3]EFP90878.1 hypothetical protein PGTG_17077 [Puccinia graminis f. sp. tritici CRL 75-36-700-3]KAA1115553.1 hypothetical protein PGT21_037041 [Puccinia graminis f. sp. tritici]
MFNHFRWQLLISPVPIWLILWLIVSSNNHNLVLGSSDHLSQDGVPMPQAASPPRPPSFDQSDEIEIEAFPADPAPATPPTPFPPANQQPDGSNPPIGSAPLPIREKYTGKEYRFKRFVIRPAQLKLEGALLVALIIYTLTSYRGKSKNEDTVAHWWDSHSELLRTQFSQVGAGSSKGYIADGPALFYGYATGRKGCQALTIRFALRPRQDLPFMIYEELRAAIDFSWTGRSDRLELVWSLAPRNQHFEAKDSFVWALVEKRVMNVVREDRWDVRTFTEVKESNQLPSHLVFMSESGEINEQIIKNKELGLLQLLQNNPSSLDWFDSLVLSGTSQQEPSLSELPLPLAPSARTITLRLRLPPHSRTLDPMPLIEFCFNLIDSIDQVVSLTAIATSKLTKRRADVSNLLLDEERKFKEREKEEERRKKLKAAQDEKLAKMTPTEQRKFSERERKRNAAKIGKTSVKRK